MNFKKIVSFFIILFCFVFLIAGFLRSNVSEVKAAPSPLPEGSVVVSGYAWSDTIGWIEFNPSFGGVFYDLETRKLSGHAWSDNIGWIKFDGLSSYPDSLRGSVATADTGGFISGWARACAGTVKGDCTTMESRLDGWDGWISLSRKPSGAGADYGVKIDLVPSSQTYGDFSGYAWGSDVVGWIKFNCQDTPGECAQSNYKVRANLPGVPLEVFCVEDPSSVFLGETVSFTAKASGGTAPYSYAWTGDDGLAGTTETASKSYSTIGIKSATISVKDAKGDIKNASCSVEVKSATILIPSYNVSPDSVSIKVNGTAQFKGVYNSDKTGTSADESDVTNLASWTSSDTSIASITTSGDTGRGLATCLKQSAEGNDVVITSKYTNDDNKDFIDTATLSCSLDKVDVWITADPAAVYEDSNATIKWGSENATSCEHLDGGSDSDWKKINKDITEGSFITSSFGKIDRTYAIKCTDDISVDTDSVEVKVIEPKKLTVEVIGNGMSLGSAVTSVDDKKLIDCKEDCNQDYDFNEKVTLKANPQDDYLLSKWSGCDFVDNNQCILTMDDDKKATATFIKKGDITITASNITATIIAGLKTNSFYFKDETNLSVRGNNCKDSNFNLKAVFDKNGDVGDIRAVDSKGSYALEEGNDFSGLSWEGNLVVKNIPGKTLEKAYPIKLTVTCISSITDKEIGKIAEINLIIKKIMSSWLEI